MNTLIIGNGEVGKSIYSVLSKKYNTRVIDVGESVLDLKIEIMHVCFPYTKKFISEVNKYKKIYKPKYVVIHSTVPIGTSNKCKAYFSPIRGIHPHLEKSLKIFVKYLAPKSKVLKSYFQKAGIEIEETCKQETLEAMKLYCTTIYALNVIAEKEFWELCNKNKLDYNLAYTRANKTYNEGYERLGYPQYSKYILSHKVGKIGGHCLIPNCKLLKNSALAKFILKQNEKL